MAINITQAARSWITSVNTHRFLSFQPASAQVLEDVVGAVRRVLRGSGRPSTGGRGQVSSDLVVQVGDEVWFRVLAGGEPDQRSSWLTTVAESLADAGLAGRIDRPRRLYAPDPVLRAGIGRRGPRTWFNFDAAATRGDRPPPVTELDAQTMHRLLELFPVDSQQAHVGASQANFPVATGDGLAAFLIELAAPGVASAICASDESDVVWFNIASGPVVTASRTSAATWRELVTESREAILALADRLLLAYIRAAQPHSYAGQADPPPEPPCGEYWPTYFASRQLWSEWVFDAHGVQLVTGRVLRRAHDLARWRITEAAPDRYLVEAEDLEPWYAESEPDPGTLARARDDFGDMIVSGSMLREIQLARQGSR